MLSPRLPAISGNAILGSATLAVALLILPALGRYAASGEPAPARTVIASPVHSGASSARPSVRAPAATPALASPAAVSSAAPGSSSAPLSERRNSQPRVVADVSFESSSCSPMRCGPRLDVFVPAGSGPFPTAVLVRGGPSGPGGRAYLDPFARLLAQSGVLVFNADIRDVGATGGGYPAAFEDVACAIRFARGHAGDYGGGTHVTLVGHSLGAYVGAVVALKGDEFGGPCLATSAGAPEAFVGLAGNYQLDAQEVAGDLATFFGPGRPAQTRGADPFADGTSRRIPVRLVAGTADRTVNPRATTSMAAFLTAGGWDVTATLVPAATHGSIITPSADAGTSVHAVLDAISAGPAGDRRSR